MKTLKAVLVFAMVLCFTIASMAESDVQPYVVGQDLWLNNFYDDRTYDESHPRAGMQHNLGGWQIGISAFGENLRNRIARVEIIGSGGQFESKTVITSPDVYGWMGKTLNDYIIFTGVVHLTSDQYEIIAYDDSGNRITFVFPDSPENVLDSFYVSPGKGNPLPPKCDIKKMVVKKNGDVRMKFSAPFHPDVNHIRIRIFDDAGNGIYETRIDPDADTKEFRIVKKNGTVVPDKVKVILDAEFAGHTGRIEYRTNGTDGDGNFGYMMRGITYFKLPEPEEPAVPLARCFTLDGTIQKRVNSMGAYWDASTLFAQKGLNVGSSVSYQICTNEEGGFTSELRAYPVMGGSMSDCGPEDPAEYMNSGTYDPGYLAAGTCDEYVQVAFYEHPPQSWVLGDSFSMSHSIHQPLNPAMGYGDNWYSRVLFTGTVISIDPF